MQVGDKFNIPNVFMRRTFWQWMTRQPKTLQVFEILTVDTSETLNPDKEQV